MVESQLSARTSPPMLIECFGSFAAISALGKWIACGFRRLILAEN
jgi:hypothetical protein